MRESLAQIGKLNVSELLDMKYEPIAAGNSPKELACFAGFSNAYFSRRFEDLFGCTPHDYLRTSRVELAKHLVFSGETAL